MKKQQLRILIKESQSPFLFFKKEFRQFYKYKEADGKDIICSFVDYLVKKYSSKRNATFNYLKKYLFLQEAFFSEHIPHSKQIILPRMERLDQLLSYKKKLGYIDFYNCKRRGACLECSKIFGDRLIFNCKGCPFFCPVNYQKVNYYGI